MKHSILFMFIIWLANSACGQQFQLNITDLSTGKSFTLHTSKNVQVKTVSGTIFKGTLKILDENSIQIETKTIVLPDVLWIKIPQSTTTNIGKGCIWGGGCASIVGGSSCALGLINSNADILNVGLAFLSVGITSVIIGAVLKNLRLPYHRDDYIMSIQEIKI